MSFNILRTESESDLAKLRAEVEEDIYPTDSIEREFVADIVRHTWEIWRYERVETGIHNNALGRALAQILYEILLPPSKSLADKCWMSAQQLAHGWLVDPQTNRRVTTLLREAGYDPSAIDAKAQTLVADDLADVHRICESTRQGRDRALRSIAKYRKNPAVHLRRNSDRALVADQAPIIPADEEN